MLEWKDLQDGVDVASCEPINNIAHAVIENTEMLGEVETALDKIIAIQNTLIGGESV